MRRRQAPHAILWSMPVAPDHAVAGPDGRFLVVEHRPGGLVALTDDAATPVLTIYDRGRPTRTVRLGETAVPDLLPRTASHRIWAGPRYFADATHYAVSLPTGRDIVLDLTGGPTASRAAAPARRD